MKCTCDPGYSGNDGGACSACIAGTFKMSNGSAPCLDCTAGKYSSAVGAVSAASCSNCPAHSSSSQGSPQVTDCLCNAGYTGGDGQECVACRAGAFKDTIGSAPCSMCPSGKYQNLSGSCECKTCPDNAKSPAGSTSGVQCSCKAGYQSLFPPPASLQDAGDGVSNCVECPTGSYAIFTCGLSEVRAESGVLEKGIDTVTIHFASSHLTQV